MRESGDGAGAGGGAGGGPFWEAGAFGLARMGPITAAGWRHCCGSSLPNETVIPLLLGRKGRWGGETGVSLTPVVSQTNCSLWKHASKCFGIVSNRVLDATHSAAHRSVSSPGLLVAPLPDILMTLILFFFFLSVF